jgi:hypothetical protein
LKDCVIGMYTPTQCTVPFTHSFLEAHQQAFEQFGMLHRDIHLANMYVKNLGELQLRTSKVIKFGNRFFVTLALGGIHS